MKDFVLLIVSLLPLFSSAQIITTFAGTGVAANYGDEGAATAAAINYPVGGIFDKNDNYYFTTGIVGHTVRKISPSGIISTVAGITGTSGFSGDGGAATNAKLNNPQSVVADAEGNLFISDSRNNRVRKVTVATGVITTVIGTGLAGYSGDMGPATLAMLNNPLGLCFDNLGNLYIADNGNNRVRKVSSFGNIITVAGNGVPGNSINGASATAAPLLVFGLCSEKLNNIYLADGHGAVYLIKPTGVISYFVGNGTDGFSGDGGMANDAITSPYYVVIDRYNNLYIGETQQHRIRLVKNSGIINTVVGNGLGIFAGDGGPAIDAQINFPGGVALDSCGNLYIAESHSWRIRKVAFPKCNYLSVNEQKKAQTTINIYPNPATEELHIEGLTTRSEYMLLNVTGIIKQRGILKKGGNTIAVPYLPHGVYMLLITDQEGKRKVHKVVKE